MKYKDSKRPFLYSYKKTANNSQINVSFFSFYVDGWNNRYSCRFAIGISYWIFVFCLHGWSEPSSSWELWWWLLQGVYYSKSYTWKYRAWCHLWIRIKMLFFNIDLGTILPYTFTVLCTSINNPVVAFVFCIYFDGIGSNIFGILLVYQWLDISPVCQKIISILC